MINSWNPAQVVHIVDILSNILIVFFFSMTFNWHQRYTATLQSSQISCGPKKKRVVWQVSYKLCLCVWCSTQKYMCTNTFTYDLYLSLSFCEALSQTCLKVHSIIHPHRCEAVLEIHHSLSLPRVTWKYSPAVSQFNEAPHLPAADYQIWKTTI